MSSFSSSVILTSSLSWLPPEVTASGPSLIHMNMKWCYCGSWHSLSDTHHVMYQVFKESWLFHLHESNHIIQAFLYFLWPTFFAITLNTLCIVLQVFHALPVSSLHFLWKHSSSFYISPCSLDGFIC